MENSTQKLVDAQDVWAELMEDGLICFSHDPSGDDELVVSSLGKITYNRFRRRTSGGLLSKGYENFEFHQCRFFFGGFEVDGCKVSNLYCEQLIRIVRSKLGLW